ncbi:MAG: Crp/Fnr family transcriptional regulator [Bacteroidales bacterium]|nr:Crp/Fnr family transcriptional regulator [Bacteroidales bacterium]MBN2699213.1 Crp/Fnr family transcriptional regulator [Bacteroidales bacterium]
MPDSFENIQCESCLTRTQNLFRHLTDSEIHQIALNKITQFYKRGSILYQENSHIKGFYCVQKGIIKIFKTGFDGKQQIIRFAKPGDIIGYRSVLSNEMACSSSQVLENCIVCKVPSDILVNLVKHNGNFALELLKLSCKELGEANTFLTDIAQKSARERLAEIILFLQNEFGSDVNGVLKLILTREELANIVGTATESVIRLLSEFKTEKLIELNGRKIKILDAPGLKLLANI